MKNMPVTNINAPKRLRNVLLRTLKGEHPLRVSEEGTLEGYYDHELDLLMIQMGTSGVKIPASELELLFRNPDHRSEISGVFGELRSRLSATRPDLELE